MDMHPQTHEGRHAVSLCVSSPFILVYFVLFLAAALLMCPLLGSSKLLLQVVIEIDRHVH